MNIIKKHVKHWGKTNLDGGISYIIVSGAENMTDEQISQKLSLSPYNGGIGQLFIDAPFIRRKGKYCHVSITWGIDC